MVHCFISEQYINSNIITEMSKYTQSSYSQFGRQSPFLWFSQALVSPSASLRYTSRSTTTPSLRGHCSTSTHHSAALCRGRTATMHGTQKTAPTTLARTM